jgi:hypothetical protein
MKGFLAILVIATAGYMGYKYEPAMRYQLTGLPPTVPPAPAATATPQTTPASPATPAVTPPAIDLAKLTPAQLPAQVTLKVTTEVADASGLKMKIDPGNRLKLVRLEGDQVVVSPGSSPFEGRVPVSGTDLMEQLAANPPVPVTVPTAVPEPTAPAVSEPVPAVTQPATALATITPAPEPAVPAPPAAASTSGSTADGVEAMKQHIRSGAIKEFTFEQVLGWKAEADETINGETYQTGLVRYKADTIFGVKTIEAKALIQKGKVVRWVWPKSGMEIK